MRSPTTFHRLYSEDTVEILTYLAAVTVKFTRQFSNEFQSMLEINGTSIIDSFIDNKEGEFYLVVDFKIQYIKLPSNLDTIKARAKFLYEGNSITFYSVKCTDFQVQLDNEIGCHTLADCFSDTEINLTDYPQEFFN